VWHEETQATASQTVARKGHYLVVFDEAEADLVCEYIRHGGDREALLARFAHAVSEGFDPDRELQRVGLANQTTMLMSESLAIGEMFRQALVDRWGEDALSGHYLAFDTICSATQDRQDAVEALLKERDVDLMLVLGGYNSSNTANLARICAQTRPTFHIASPECLVSAQEIRHRPIGSKEEVSTRGWLPKTPVSIGLTSGASTPDNLIAATIHTLDGFCH
jgi:4-hydroxy-3-methylbut-2-enyl diphosphate reductase